jgi:succinoglycan biosynthesis protein ExoM
MMEHRKDHISVCICTYQRPSMLLHLLERLKNQITDDLFTYSLVIVDNDYLQSAKPSVDFFRNNVVIDIDYYCEPEQNIALARNKAVQNAKGNFVALIDDDEYPNQDWLLILFKASNRYAASAILGPVQPHFAKAPPRWVIKGKFYERDRYETGHVLRWQDTRTGNALLRKAIFDDPNSLFRREFGRGGEDKDFFKRAAERDHVFVWCNEAPVFETIPPERCKRVFMLKRALLRGKATQGYSTFGKLSYMVSVIAVPTYALLLPFSLLGGQHFCIKLLTAQFEHIGRLLALLGFDVIKEYYVTK